MPSKTKTITLTETDLPAADSEVLDCWLAAKRAHRQAEAILKKLAVRVLVLAKRHPKLLHNGARITVGRNTTWTYTAATQRQMADLAALQLEEREEKRAIGNTTEHVVLQELAKFAGQPLVNGERAGIFRSLFGGGT